jgi:hypothetical protein
MPLTSKDQLMRGDPMAMSQAQNPAIASLLRAEAERVAAERMLVQHVQELRARVETLERALAALTECAVQQRWDGRLYLPAHRPLVLDATVNGSRLAIEAAVRPMLEPPVNGATIPFAAGVPAAPLPLPTGPSTSQGQSSLSSMAGAAGAGTSWQSIAASNSVDNPLTRKP